MPWPASQWLERQPEHQRVTGLVLEGTYLGCVFAPLPSLGVCGIQLVVFLSHRCISLSFSLYPPSPPSTLSEEQWKKYPQMRINQKERIGDCDQIEAFKNFRSFIEAVTG